MIISQTALFCVKLKFVAKVLHALRYFFMMVNISTSSISIFSVDVYCEVALKQLTQATELKRCSINTGVDSISVQN